MFQVLILTCFALLLNSCASYMVRKNCDNQNWYQIGLDAATRGERFAEDPLVIQCRKANAVIAEQQLDSGWKAGMSRYCRPETALQMGKNGDPLASELCENGQAELLKKKHAEGLKAYCLNGTAAGLSGKKYKNACPAKEEKTFLVNYRSARKKYLDSTIATLEIRRRDTSIELDNLEFEERMIDDRRSSLPTSRVGDKDPYEEERRRLSNTSWTLTNKITLKRGLKSQIEKELGEHLKEATSLNSPSAVD